MRKKIAVLMTCHNRRENTIKCIETLSQGNEELDLRYVVADDNSTDGTREALANLNLKLKILEGDGNLFWGGGMRLAMGYALRHVASYDYVLLVNDDVSFYNAAISKMVKELNASRADVLVGATNDSSGKQSYGGVRCLSKHLARFELVNPLSEDRRCDLFNCNCVLIPSEIFGRIGNLDSVYVHSMGDYDYGMAISRAGYSIESASEYVGICDDNDDSGTWRDTTLSRKERIRLKKGPKGLPDRDWFHFIKKNYGIVPAIYHSITPYIRIFLKK